MNFKRALVLSPHTDDGELGAGATIARLVEEGTKVEYVALSAPLEELKKEVYRALRCFDTSSNGVNLDLWNYERRLFPKYRQQILDRLYLINKRYNPDLVLMPSNYDTHQDHETVNREAKRCFKKSTILGYILRWNCEIVKEDVFIEITEEQLAKKIQALHQYYSQIKQDRKYFNPMFHQYEAFVRGLTRTDTGYAEAFELIRLYYEIGD